MNTVTLGLPSAEATTQRMAAAFRGEVQGAHLSFASAELLWKVLAPNRMALVQALAGVGPISLREAARRVGRDVRAVHSDVHMLLNAGVLRRDETGRIEFPYTGVHVDFKLKSAA